jgi:ABC-type glycerol-3-phosphate transport system substrate-binding protein
MEEYAERVTNDLAGGTGPDVLFTYLLPSMDVAKAALNNNFLDLTNILAGAEDFSEDDYIDGVFDAGRYNGRQYTIPTAFITPLYLSAESKLEDIGLAGQA